MVPRRRDRPMASATPSRSDQRSAGPGPAPWPWPRLAPWLYPDRQDPSAVARLRGAHLCHV